MRSLDRLCADLAIRLGASLALLTAVAGRLPGDVQVSAGVAVGVGDDGLRSFDLAVCEHFRCDSRAVLVVRKHGIPDEELPVALFLAQRAQVSPDFIVGMRVGGRSWWDICAHFGFAADIFYVETSRDHGPPYGNAFGHFRNRKRAEWAAIRLGDADIVTLVNVKFLSAHYGCSADDILGFRQTAKSFVEAHRQAQKAKESRTGGTARGPGGGEGGVAGGGKAGNQRGAGEKGTMARDEGGRRHEGAEAGRSQSPADPAERHDATHGEHSQQAANAQEAERATRAEESQQDAKGQQGGRGRQAPKGPGGAAGGSHSGSGAAAAVGPSGSGGPAGGGHPGGGGGRGGGKK